ncbi:hypothetical protein TMatcc_000914 [Talaromyces marneffei ATCC 18224]|uniref:DUF7492 domain-containing protein n=2 Tax=Talaromyces marneffei TaxID=37727 RepID=B6QNZ3_TALMQ|nr:uncharacterized protein EYB26_003455 [Talaromyces marneffei]EEA20914.1 conserved hypothetical protein [Talaromyces marneffei ATCC 18224]KAE8549869.1 hypothetical protein EYB25_008393 [Talaromyces marneffei]QGA15795.1 hypothetical protein EYB26_003455 [Talaromyces marneffei]
MQDIKTALVLVTTLLASLAHAHSWVEALSLLSPNGSFTGNTGYPRGMILRSDPAFVDTNIVWQLPAAPANQLSNSMTVCKPSQQTSNYPDSSLPKLQAYPGANIALRYQENGHVTTPWSKPGKPVNSGIVYVYGTSQPKEDDTLLGIHGQWTLDGKGGDGRGRLLTSQYFDDGQCYQINLGYISEQRQTQFQRVAEAGSFEGANLWCQTDVRLPDNLDAGKDYTLYWVWDWSTMDDNGKVTLPELYTTCMDVTIADTKKVGDTGAVVPDGDSKSVPFVSITNYGEAAIQTVFESLAATMTVPPVSAIVPVNITASVSYSVAASMFAHGVSPSAAAAAGASSAAAYLATMVLTPTGSSTMPAGAAATAAAVTSAPPATNAASVPPTNPPRSAARGGGGGCSVETVTVTITTTVPSQPQVRSTGLLARRRILALDDDDDEDFDS